ncbi:hypothetical protein E5288_WYG018733 [Bos mutus]|uniref:TBC1 domain family member 5 n=1 Tax=Bos mutus TaxID=72004 RepID=A0A6B0QZ87_9CETA|nr:hypothetical protein [Bos mutus]
MRCLGTSGTARIPEDPSSLKQPQCLSIPSICFIFIRAIGAPWCFHGCLLSDSCHEPHVIRTCVLGPGILPGQLEIKSRWGYRVSICVVYFGLSRYQSESSPGKMLFCLRVGTFGDIVQFSQCIIPCLKLDILCSQKNKRYKMKETFVMYFDDKTLVFTENLLFEVFYIYCDNISRGQEYTIGDSNQNGRTSSLDSDGTFNSYRKEWEELFVNNNYLATIRQKGINGQLRSSRFRSICWKLFLCVLPQDKSQWISKIKELRAWYSSVKEIHITNPRKAVGQQDLMINNPLSQDEGSLWNKFFQDKELRSMIEQDVKRTFPEMQFFQQESVRKILTDVLFCYARENEQLLYKQGMHELLAPIVFTLHCDHQAFLHASESAQPRQEMKTLLNPEYLEHDAYAMFSQLMETAEPWFSTFEHDGQKGKETLMPPIPFARPQDLGPTIAIVTKVNQIQDQLLKKHDIELYMHLNRLEIAPQIYGLRWVRLLFGREFPLQDLLVVWDALFADGLTLTLVDYVFVAMLLYIRDALISSNYQTCLGLLMHYPLIGDVHSLILKALFLRDPKRNPRPVTYQFHPNLDYYKARGADLMNKSRTNAKGAPLNINKVSNSLINFGRKLISPAAAPGSAGGPVAAGGAGAPSPAAAPTRTLAEAPRHALQQQQQRLMKSESMPVQLNKGDVVTGSDAQVSVPVQTLTDLPGQSSKNISSSPSIESLPGGREFTGSPPSSAAKKDSFFSNISRSRSHSKTMGRRESEEELEAQISFLQGQLNDLDAMCKYCAKVMDTHLGECRALALGVVAAPAAGAGADCLKYMSGPFLPSDCANILRSALVCPSGYT